VETLIKLFEDRSGIEPLKWFIADIIYPKTKTALPSESQIKFRQSQIMMNASVYTGSFSEWDRSNGSWEIVLNHMAKK
jgi:hypothetical protein